MRAYSSYALMLERGKGVERNLIEAGSWFEKAARQGDAEAAFNLGIHYATGFGGAVMDMSQLAKARVWLELAAGTGHGQAKAMLATDFFKER